jgi:hypothetical protein
MIDRYNNFYKERSASREKKTLKNQIPGVDINKENQNVNNRLKNHKPNIPVANQNVRVND